MLLAPLCFPVLRLSSCSSLCGPIPAPSFFPSFLLSSSPSFLLLAFFSPFPLPSPSPPLHHRCSFSTFFSFVHAPAAANLYKPSPGVFSAVNVHPPSPLLILPSSTSTPYPFPMDFDFPLIPILPLPITLVPAATFAALEHQRQIQRAYVSTVSIGLSNTSFSPYSAAAATQASLQNSSGSSSGLSDQERLGAIVDALGEASAKVYRKSVVSSLVFFFLCLA